MSIDWDKPIETEDGHPARVISRDYRGTMNNNEVTLFVVQIERPHASHVVICESEYKSTYIRNRKTKREGWVNVYLGNRVSDAYKTESLAKSSASNGVLATIKIEWEE